MKKREPKTDHRYAYDGLDRVIHERARLSILTSLAIHPKGLSFNELKSFCALTDGNLNRHLQVLEDARLILSVKDSQLNRRLTCCRLTALGRRRFLGYLEVLEQVLTDTAAVSAEGMKDPLSA